MKKDLVIPSKEEDDFDIDYAHSKSVKRADTTLYEHVTEVQNNVTGEIEQRTKVNVSRRSNQTDNFVAIYTENISSLLDLNFTKCEWQVLVSLLQYVLPRNNQLLLDSATRKRIALELNHSPRSNSVSKAINSLEKKKVIVKINGSYFLSPFPFGKGDFNNIKKMRIKVEKDFDFQTGDITVVRSSTASYDDPDALEDNSTYKLVDATQEKYVDPADGVKTLEQKIEVVQAHDDEELEIPDYSLLEDIELEKTPMVKLPQPTKNIREKELEVEKLRLEKEKIDAENKNLELQIRLLELQGHKV